jgi:hypothetical protein
MNAGSRFAESAEHILDLLWACFFYVLPMATYPVLACAWVKNQWEMAMQAADSPVVYSSYVEALMRQRKQVVGGDCILQEYL